MSGAILCFKCRKFKKSGLISSVEELATCCLCDDKEISEMFKSIMPEVKETQKQDVNETVVYGVVLPNIISAIKPNVISKFCHSMAATMQEWDGMDVSRQQFAKLFEECFLKAKEELGL